MPDFRIAEALRLLRTQNGLTQVAASQRSGAPGYRTLSHWETRRKYPSLLSLHNYLICLGLDFRDLQNALDQIEGKVGGTLEHRLSAIERRLVVLEQYGTPEGG